MRPFPRGFGAFLLGLLVSCPLLRADEPTEPAPALDEVVLVHGGILEGTVLEETPEHVTIALPEGAGGSARLTIPRSRVREIRLARERPAVPRGPDAPLRDAWFLLQTEGRTVGTRHHLLKRHRAGEVRGWRIEEHLVWFARGSRAPEVRSSRTETTDLAFRPLLLEYREESDPPPGADASTRFSRRVSGKGVDGAWTFAVTDDGERREVTLSAPPDARGRLGTREDLLRRREAGLSEWDLIDGAGPRLARVKAGYTQLGSGVPGDARADEFAWEEDGRRLTTRVGSDGVLSEEVAEGIVAVPASAAQAEAADRESKAGGAEAKTTIAEVGLEFATPGPSWTVERPVVSATDSGPHVVASLSSPLAVADVRVEWDPDAALASPGPEEAEEALLQRLRTASPDLEVVVPRRPMKAPAGAWRLEVVGTVKKVEKVRAIVVVLDRGQGRITVLCTCPVSSWAQGSPDLEAFVASLRRL